MSTLIVCRGTYLLTEPWLCMGVYEDRFYQGSRIPNDIAR